MDNRKSKNKSLITAWIKVSFLFAILKTLSSIIVDRGFFIEKMRYYLLEAGFCFALVGMIVGMVYIVGRFIGTAEKTFE